MRNTESQLLKYTGKIAAKTTWQPLIQLAQGTHIPSHEALDYTHKRRREHEAQ